MSRYDDGQYDEHEDAWERRVWERDEDRAVAIVEIAERHARLTAPPTPTPEPSEDDRCGMCGKRRDTTGGLCASCSASASEPAWMARAWGG